MKYEDLAQELKDKQAFLVNADVCPGCLQTKDRVGVYYIPLDMDINGEEYKRVATLICADCTEHPDHTKINNGLYYLLSEFKCEAI